jgi:MFS transporter, PPP family, 3-phenylpropionic acid transporter
MPSKRPIMGNYFFFYIAMGGALPFLAPYLKEIIHVSNGTLGVLLMIRPAVALAAQPFWSYMADVRGGRARIAVFLAAASAVLFPLLVFTRSVAWVAVLTAVWSFFYTPINALSDSLTFDYLGHKRRLHFSTLRIFASLGFLAGVAGMGAFYQKTGLRWMFPMFAAGMAVSAFMLNRMPGQAHATAEKPGAFRSLFSNRNVLVFMAAILLTEIANQMGYFYLSVYARSLGAGYAQVGWLWAIATGAEMVAMLFMPKIIGRFGVQKVLFAGVAAVALRWGLFAAVRTWQQLIPVQLIQIVTIPFVYVGAVTFMDMESTADIRFTAQAFYSTVIVCGGMIIGSLAGGLISQRAGYPVIYILAGGLAVAAGLIVSLFVKEPPHAPTRQLF